MSIDSHIQPQHFLKGFLAPKDENRPGGFLFVYKKGMPYKIDGTRSTNNPSNPSPINTAFAKNFYGYRKEDGTFDSETYENKLTKDVENPANPILDKLRKIQLSKNEVISINDFLSAEEKERFSFYVGAMCSRTKLARAWHNTAAQETVEHAETVGFPYANLVSNLPVEERERLEKDVTKNNPHFDKSAGNLLIPPKILANTKDTFIKGESFPKGVFSSAEILKTRILQMRWQIRLTPPLHTFFTGDAPVIWADLDQPEAILLFPISSNIIFCASKDCKIQEKIFLEKEMKFVENIRNELAHNCQELYFSKQCKWLVEFFNRRSS